jgi:hypothetical protein
MQQASKLAEMYSFVNLLHCDTEPLKILVFIVYLKHNFKMTTPGIHANAHAGT